jgi:hypothetical protein
MAGEERQGLDLLDRQLHRMACFNDRLLPQVHILPSVVGVNHRAMTGTIRGGTLRHPIRQDVGMPRRAQIAGAAVNDSSAA